MKESKFSNFIWGLVFLGLGVIFLGNNLKIWDIDVFFDGWWTLFIIIPSFLAIFKRGSKFSSLFGLIIGILLLLGCQDIIGFQLIGKLIVPLIFIMLGLSIIFKQKKIVDPNYKEIKKDEDSLNLIAIFSGREEKYTTLKGANCISVFGGIDLDLREAKLKKDIVIDVVACFGGVDILLPNDVNVITSGIPFFGGIDSKISQKENAKTTIYINYVAVFGGIDIK